MNSNSRCRTIKQRGLLPRSSVVDRRPFLPARGVYFSTQLDLALESGTLYPPPRANLGGLATPTERSRTRAAPGEQGASTRGLVNPPSTRDPLTPPGSASCNSNSGPKILTMWPAKVVGNPESRGKMFYISSFSSFLAVLKLVVTSLLDDAFLAHRRVLPCLSIREASSSARPCSFISVSYVL